MLKQLSVFIENREGRICELAEVLANHNINIYTLSLADTADYGMVRMIVNNAMKAYNALKEAGYSTMVVDVIAVKVTQEVGSFYHFVKLLVANGISVEYIYTLMFQCEPSLILKVSDVELSIQILTSAGYELVNALDIEGVDL